MLKNTNTYKTDLYNNFIMEIQDKTKGTSPELNELLKATNYLKVQNRNTGYPEFYCK
jgi:hypothetical protein